MSDLDNRLTDGPMRRFRLFLLIIAPIFFIVGALHLVLGLGADALLGATIDPTTMSDPALDSQNRFYGVAFTLYGALLFLCVTDIPKYSTVLRYVVWVFFAAGVARLLSIVIHGVPPPSILLLTGSELAAPLLLVWLSRVRTE